MKDSLDSSPLWVTITILYIRPCSKFWKENLWTWGSTWALSWRVRSGLYRKMWYQLSSPSEVVQLKDRCLVEFSVILRLVTAAGTGKIEKQESETEFCHTPDIAQHWRLDGLTQTAPQNIWSLPLKNIDFTETPKQGNLNIVNYWCWNKTTKRTKKTSKGKASSKTFFGYRINVNLTCVTKCVFLMLRAISEIKKLALNAIWELSNGHRWEGLWGEENGWETKGKADMRNRSKKKSQNYYFFLSLH